MIFVIDQTGRFLYATDVPDGSVNWTAVQLPQPCWNPRFKGERISETGEWKGQWEHDGEPVPTVADLYTTLDNCADQARRIFAVDPLRAIEYQRVAAEAQAFKDAGYPEEAVPRSVAAWAISGRTPQEAADGILIEATRYAEVLYLIRERRLEAKELIKARIAGGAINEARQILDEAVKAIQAAVAGVEPVQG
jgi:hypothetical protein